MGGNAREQALVMNWNEQISTEGLLAGAEALRNHVKGFESRSLTGPENFRQIPELAERGRARLLLFMSVLEQRLSESPYIALDRFTMADIGAQVCVDFAGWVKVSIDERWPNLRRWHDEVSARPGASA